MQDYSSTKVRAALLPGGDAATAKRMVGSAAVVYIRARGLYGAAPDAATVCNHRCPLVRLCGTAYHPDWENQ